MPSDWTQPPFVESPGDLGPALLNARLTSVENDRSGRRITLRFALPPDAGTPTAAFAITEATHLLAFAYIPPTEPLPEEDALSHVGDWARQGLVSTFDPTTVATPLVVQRAFLHALDETVTLSVEGYGEDPDLLVWWEVRISGRGFEPVTTS